MSNINQDMVDAHNSLEFTFARAESAVAALRQALWDLTNFPNKDINHFVEEEVGLENMGAWRDKILEDWFTITEVDKAD